MTPDAARRSRAREVFLDLIELDPADRAIALIRRCGEDVELRREVAMLLDAAQQAGGFIDPAAEPDQHRQRDPSDHPDPGAPGVAAVREVPGARVGPYRLLELLGEGGFGTVFLAEQEFPMRRRVALKIIKLGMDTRRVIARFEAERQVLAMMEHPNIARVLDAGATASGRPYFVMEHVVGETITAFADRHRLDVRARIALFIQVCHAVQHAHTKGVIHRDIKPGNVLVSMTDGRPFARIIDFGIAKAISSGAVRFTDRTLYTESGQPIGTPDSMSPEQARGSRDIDTRTDIYALGVLLYELLTGLTPFDRELLRQADPSEVQRIIIEDDPPTPSVRLSRSRSTKTPAGPAEQAAPAGRDESQRLDPGVHRELDWIVMKAMEKEPHRRYETPGQFAADLERHLRGEAVFAAPPGAVYRLRKFAARHRGAVTAGAVVAAALGLGLIGTTAGLITAFKRARGEHVATLEALAQKEAANAARDEAIRARLEAERNIYVANIRGAQSALASDQLAAARSLLAQCPEPERHFEWRYLAAQADAGLGMVAGSEPVFGPCGTRVATVVGREIQISDVARQRELRRLAGSSASNGFGSVRFSPDGTLVAAGDGDGVTHLWNSESGVRMHRLDGHSRAINAVAFDPAGMRLLTASSDATARVWDVGTGTVLLQLRGHAGPIAVAAFDADGGRIVTGSHDGTVRLWDATSGRELLVLAGHTSWVGSARFLGDGARLATSCSYDDTTRVWDSETGSTLLRLQGFLVDLSDDGERLLIVRRGGAQVRSSVSGALLWQTPPNRLISAARFAGGGIEVVTVDQQPRADRWSLGVGDGSASTTSPIATTIGSWSGPPIMSPDRRFVATAMGSRVLLNAAREATAPPRRSWSSDQPEPVHLTFSPPGNRLLVRHSDRSLHLLDADSGVALNRLLPSHQIRMATFSGDGLRLLAVAQPRWCGAVPCETLGDPPTELWLLDATTGTTIERLDADAALEGVPAFSGDGSRIASVSDDQRILVWSAADGAPLATMGPDSEHRDFQSVAFSPLGTCVFARSWTTGSGVVWNLTTQTEVARPRSPDIAEDRRAFVAYSPDEHHLIASAPSTRLHVCDARTGAPVGAPLDHAVIPHWAGFGPGRGPDFADGVGSGSSSGISSGNSSGISSGNAPDGTWISTSDGPISRFWDPMTGMGLLAGDACDALGYATTIVTSGDGRLRAAQMGDGTIGIYNAGLEEVCRIHPPGPALRVLCFSDDAARVATSDERGDVQVWELRRPEAPLRWFDHPGQKQASAAAFAPDGLSLAVFWGAGGVVRDLVKPEASSVELAPAGETQLAPRFTEDGTRLIAQAGGSGSIVALWDVQTGRHLPDTLGMMREAGRVRSAEFNADLSRVIVWTVDGTALLLDVERGATIAMLADHEPISHVGAASADGRRLLTSAGRGGAAQLWDVVSGFAMDRLLGHASAIRAVAITPDGAHAVTGSTDGTAIVWRLHADAGPSVAAGPGTSPGGVLEAGPGAEARAPEDPLRGASSPVRMVDTLRVGRGTVSLVAIAPDASRVVTVADDGTVRTAARTAEGARTAHLWLPGSAFAPAAPTADLAPAGPHHGALVRELTGHASAITSVAFSPDGSLLMTASTDLVRLWSGADGSARGALSHVDPITAATFDGTGARIATASERGEVKVWNAATAEARTVGQLDGAPSMLLFAPCGTRLLVARRDGTCIVLDAATGAVLSALEGHLDDVVAACFTPDGARLFTASKDRSLRLWDVLRGVELLQLASSGGTYTRVWMTPDGRTVHGLRDDGLISVWESTPQRWVLEQERRDEARTAPTSSRERSDRPDVATRR